MGGRGSSEMRCSPFSLGEIECRLRLYEYSIISRLCHCVTLTASETLERCTRSFPSRLACHGANLSFPLRRSVLSRSIKESCSLPGLTYRRLMVRCSSLSCAAHFILASNCWFVRASVQDLGFHGPWFKGWKSCLKVIFALPDSFWVLKGSRICRPP